MGKNDVDRLREQITELEMIFHLSLGEIFVTDGQGICVRVNAACQKHYGLKEEEMIGKHVTELVNEGLFQPSTTLKVLEEKREVTLIQSSSKGKKLHVTSTPVFNNEGEIIRVISNSVDITDVLTLQNKIEEMEKVIQQYNSELEKLRRSSDAYGQLVVKSSAMKKIFKVLEQVAKVDSTLLLLGESGVGKTKIAQWVHENSHRSQHAFIEINCNAIPPTLFESELFGYEPGSFSGANKTGSIGLIEAAEKGTLFLDEIGDLSLDLQAKLLQVIQSQSFIKIGGRKKKKVDVRIIAATNQDLEKLIEQKKFRRDLYYRLSVVPIKIPSLRERKEDIVELIFTILERINQKYGLSKEFSPHTLEQLMECDWPGNIRELENTIEKLVVTTEGNVIHTDFMNGVIDQAIQKTISTASPEEFISTLLAQPALDLKQVIEEIEQKLIMSATEKLHSTRKLAAYFGTSQSTISRKCQKYNISIQK